MKNKIKYVGLIAFICIFLTGCSGNKIFSKSLEKMSISKNMNGYTIDCRLYGTYKNNRINDIARVSNYMDKEFNISIFSMKKDQMTETNLLYKNRKMYEAKEHKYKNSNKKSVYTNTNIYLKGLNNPKKVEKSKDEVIAGKTYQVYDIVVGKYTINKIMKYTSIKNYRSKKNVKARVWINNDGYVYKILYNLVDTEDNIDELTLNVVFFGYNTSRENKI